MKTSTLMICIIILLSCILFMLVYPHTVIINSTYPESADINIQSWNPIAHPYASNVRRPLHFGHFGRFR